MWENKVQQNFEFSRLKFPQDFFLQFVQFTLQNYFKSSFLWKSKKCFDEFFAMIFFFFWREIISRFFKNHKMSLFWHTGKAMKILFMVFRDVASADDRKDFNMKSGLSVLHTLERNHKIFIKIHVMYSVSACLCSWHECWRLTAEGLNEAHKA